MRSTQDTTKHSAWYEDLGLTQENAYLVYDHSARSRALEDAINLMYSFELTGIISENDDVVLWFKQISLLASTLDPNKKPEFKRSR